MDEVEQESRRKLAEGDLEQTGFKYCREVIRNAEARKEKGCRQC